MRNLEAKFRLTNLDSARRAAESIGYAVQRSFRQRDTFFAVQSGKLKLRQQSDGAWLIHYDRVHSSGLELSNYQIVPIGDPNALRTILSNALGVIAEVRKERTLMLRENIRFHLDRVDDLGSFGEIEAVIRDGDNSESSREGVNRLLDAIGVGKDDLIDVSYFELSRSSQH